jgi:hypothetical protein
MAQFWIYPTDFNTPQYFDFSFSFRIALGHYQAQMAEGPLFFLSEPGFGQGHAV